MRDLAAVHERELDRLPLADVDDQARRRVVPVEGPDVVLDSGAISTVLCFMTMRTFTRSPAGIGGIAAS